MFFERTFFSTSNENKNLSSQETIMWMLAREISICLCLGKSNCISSDELIEKDCDVRRDVCCYVNKDIKRCLAELFGFFFFW